LKTSTNTNQSSWPREPYTPRPICHPQQLATPAPSMLRDTLQGQSFTVYQVQAIKPSQPLVALSRQLLLWPARQEVHPARSRFSFQCRHSRPLLTSHLLPQPPPKQSLLRTRLLAKFCFISHPLGTRPPQRRSVASLLQPRLLSLQAHLQAQSKVCHSSCFILRDLANALHSLRPSWHYH